MRRTNYPSAHINTWQQLPQQHFTSDVSFPARRARLVAMFAILSTNEHTAPSFKEMNIALPFLDTDYFNQRNTDEALRQKISSQET